MILELEEVALNAWPSLQTILYDGWVIRMANGYTRRANAVHPLYASTLPLDEKIDTCERLYAAHGLPAIYKLTNASQPGDLDAALAARGYERDGGNRILTRALESTHSVSPLARIEAAVSGHWLADYTRLNVERARHHALLARLFGAIPSPTAYISLWRDGQAVAVAVAVAERGYVGLFGLAVDPTLRRKGLGLQLVETCLAWGRLQGAHRAYLQVSAANAPANALYERTGFAESYRYWYRQQPV